jgi:hypothetical protein
MCGCSGQRNVEQGFRSWIASLDESLLGATVGGDASGTMRAIVDRHPQLESLGLPVESVT